MTEFIGGDAAGYFLEHGLVRRIANCAVERRGPRLDDTAGDHLAAAAAAHRALLLVVEMRRAIAERKLKDESASSPQRPSASPCWFSSMPHRSISASVCAPQSRKTRLR